MIAYNTIAEAESAIKAGGYLRIADNGRNYWAHPETNKRVKVSRTPEMKFIVETY